MYADESCTVRQSESFQSGYIWLVYCWLLHMPQPMCKRHSAHLPSVSQRNPTKLERLEPSEPHRPFLHLTHTHTHASCPHTHKLRAVWGPCRLDITWYHTLLSNTNLTTKGVWSVSARHAVLWLCLCCLKPMEKLETMFNKSLRCVLQLTVNQFCPFSGPPGYNIKNT